MKILILGASNAIGPIAFPVYMEKALAAAGVQVEVVNRSIGASPGSAALYSALTTDLAGFDLAVIDYEINETGLLSRKLRRPEEAKAVLRALFFHLRLHGVTPLVTVLPSVLSQVQPTLAEQVHLEAAMEAHVPFLNIAALFRRLQREGGNVTALMRDIVHMNVSATPIVGKLFARAVQHVLAQRAARVRVPQPALAGRAIPSDRFSGASASIELSSSLRQSRLAVLEGQSEIAIPVGAREQLVAVVYNTGAPGGVVEFRSGEKRVVKQMICCWNEQRPDAFVVQTADFRDTLPGGPEGVTLRLLPPDAPQTELTLHQREPLPGRYGRVEIEGALVLGPGGDEPVEILSRPGLELDLLSHLAPEDVLDELKSAASTQGAGSV